MSLGLEHFIYGVPIILVYTVRSVTYAHVMLNKVASFWCFLQINCWWWYYAPNKLFVKFLSRWRDDEKSSLDYITDNFLWRVTAILEGDKLLLHFFLSFKMNHFRSSLPQWFFFKCRFGVALCFYFQTSDWKRLIELSASTCKLSCPTRTELNVQFDSALNWSNCVFAIENAFRYECVLANFFMN